MKKALPVLLTAATLLASPVYAQEVSTKDAAVTLGNTLVSEQIQEWTKGENAPDWLNRTDIQIQLETSLKPQYSIETVQPLFETDRRTDFLQFRLGNDHSAGTVANLGFGQRFLSPSKQSMTGVNLFYDHGFKHGHARVGGGLEYFQGRNEYRANIYHAVSGEKEVDKVNHIFEKALSGYDVEVGTTLPNAPWMRLYLQGFVWDYKHSDDAKGYKVATEIQVTPRVGLELGYWDDNKGSGEKYAKVMYTLGNKADAMYEKGKPVFRRTETATVENKRLDKVRRENDIRVERYSKEADASVPGGTVIISFGRD